MTLVKTYQKVSFPKSRTTSLINKVGYTQLGPYAENNRIAAGQKPTRKQSVLPEGTVDTIGVRLKTSIRKSLHPLDQEERLRKTLARRTTELLNLQPHKTKAYECGEV
jgi:hypothetical protein